MEVQNHLLPCLLSQLRPLYIVKYKIEIAMAPEPIFLENFEGKPLDPYLDENRTYIF